jgi:N-acetylglucosaminyldiphosphoundecaprenol N-acetyl-beta-D-mannosaminyltransferase
MSKFIEYLGYKVLNIEYSQAREFFIEGSVLTISPNSYGVATRNKALNTALKREGLLVLDGVYFGLGYFLRNYKIIKKNQGPDIFYQELEIQKNQKGKVFFLGASDKTLDLISTRMLRDYPEIEFATLSPPFKDEFSDYDNSLIEERIKAFAPNVVFVGMTCPKQEIWVDNNIERFEGVLFMAIGGVFDWFAGVRKELHPLWWKLRLGWVGRIIQRPEIFRRNLPFILIYLKHMFRE